VLFFVIGVVKTCGSFADVKENNEHNEKSTHPIYGRKGAYKRG
jgi:hypothetical protein